MEIIADTRDGTSGDVGQVEARIDTFRDSINPEAR
jgi:hypothetical protein